MRQGRTRAHQTAFLFTAIALAGTARGQQAPTPALPDDRLGVRTAPLLLLSRPDVQAELGLTAEQVQQVGPAIADLWGRAAVLRGKTGPQAIAARKQIDAAEEAWFEAHLTPKQRSRLNQIDLQWEGFSALVSRPLVADGLALTADQRNGMKQAVERRNTARAAGTHTHDDEKTFSRAMLGYLNDSQKERYRAMVGEPFAPRLAAQPPPADESRR